MTVSIIASAQLPVHKRYARDLREMGAEVVRQALATAGLDNVDALYLGNMLSDELQSQKHLASLVADEAGLTGVEAITVRAATATGAAALRVAYLAVASGAVDTAVAVGVEKMSDQSPIPALAKALDARTEVPDGTTMLSQNARLMQLYCDRYHVSPDVFTNFSLNAHNNATRNPNALFHDRIVTAADIRASRVIVPPIRLYDCAPICDGAAAVVLVRGDVAFRYTNQPVAILASASATDRFRMLDRPEPLDLRAATLSAQRALHMAGISHDAVDFCELHDAFSIMTCLQLEALGYAEPGRAWLHAVEDRIALDGTLPISTMGGLKARGHPIGATAVYQTCEIVQQLTGQAGRNQLDAPRIGMLQSVGGVGTTVFTHVFGPQPAPHARS